MKTFNYIKKDEYGVETLRMAKLGSHIILAFIFILIFFFGSFGTIGAGERGVKLVFNAVTGKVITEGLYFKLPIIEKVVKMDVKTQKEQTDADAASKDLQTVSSTIALNYSLNPEKVAKLYQEIGKDYKERVIDPSIQESVKASTAKFTAEELITKREEVSADIKNHLGEKLTDYGIRIESLSIVNFDFSASFNDAIENKVTAEQNALAAKNKLEQIKYEAQQAIEEARGKAEATQIEGNALRSNPQVLELRAIEKWDGKMPQVTGNATPFINLNN